MLALTENKTETRSSSLKAVMTESPFVLSPDMHIHLVGIGGAGISAIARVLLGRGFTVSGSDRQHNAYTEALAASGAKIYKRHLSRNGAKADVVVISSAIPDTNP